MNLAHRSFQPWLLRLAAFVLFISGGSLAQRYLSNEATIKVLPLERHELPKSFAVLLETWKLEGNAGVSQDAAPNQTVRFAVPTVRFSWTRVVEADASASRFPRAFDAQAPPEPTR
jgi:hypothetical protein